MLEEKEIEIRSDEVQEILSHVPNWMIRWGITLIFVLVMLVIFISWFVKYPDVILGEIVVTTEQPPVKLVSKTNGYIDKLYFKDNVSIKKGETIAQITNSTNKNSIDSLTNILDRIELDNIENFLPILFKIGTLGEIQSEYNNLYNNLKKYDQFIKDNYYQNTLKHLNLQIEYNNSLAFITKSDLNLLAEEVKNAREKFHSDSILYQKEVISRNEFYIKKTEFINKQQQFNTIKKNYIQYQITVSDYAKQKQELNKNKEDKKRILITNIETSINSVKNYVKNWQQNYTIIAPIDGKLSYLHRITNNQYISASTPLFAVIPDNQEYIGNIQISAQGYGKVSKGQKVKIKLDNYPYQEYGQLIGEVREISLLSSKINKRESTQVSYLIAVTLKNELRTSYKKEIKYSPNMSGSAEVITKDLRLLERIFNQFRQLTEK